jgi:hypothetical protein
MAIGNKVFIKFQNKTQIKIKFNMSMEIEFIYINI